MLLALLYRKIAEAYFTGSSGEGGDVKVVPEMLAMTTDGRTLDRWNAFINPRDKKTTIPAFLP